MRVQTFGRRTGLRVSEFALGTANFSTSDAGAGREGSREIFDSFVAAGGTTFDASDIYQAGQAETLLGEFLGRQRDDFVVITKYSATRDPSARPTTTGNTRKNMMRSVEASLKRLQTDHIDVFMPHLPDGTTPMEEIVAGLDDLVRSGKVLHGGLSNFPAWRVSAGAARADLRGLAPLVGIETQYSLVERSAERELLPMADALGLGVLLYSPLAGGLLTGKYRRGEAGRFTGRGNGAETTQQQTAIVDSVLAIADEVGSSAIGVSLAWLRHRAHAASTALIPIVGPRTAAQLEEYLRALDVVLGRAQYERLDAVSAPDLGTPHVDVAGALRGGFDGDRTLLDAPRVPVA